MRLVVADASPVNHLILIDCIDVLRRLYPRIVLPHRVYEELGSQGAPATVTSWIQSRPDWIDLPSALSGRDERLAERYARYHHTRDP